MANNPLETHEFRFFLNFKNDTSFGKIETTEWIGFDASDYTCLQESDRYGRDVSYGSDKISLRFEDVYTVRSEQTYTLPNGVLVDRLTMGLPFLLEYHKRFGSESEVEASVERNGTEFILGLLNLQDADTDRFTYLEAILIQNTDKALFKRRSDTKVDLYATEDLDGNEAPAVETHNILLTALPIYQLSEWENDREYEFEDFNLPVDSYAVYNFGTLLKQFKVENSYAIFEPKFQLSTGFNQIIDGFRVVRAETQLTNIKITLDVDITYIMTQGTFNAQGMIALMFAYGQTITSPNQYNIFFQHEWLGSDPGFTMVVNQVFEAEIPLLNPGESIWIWGIAFGNADSDVFGTVRKWHQTIEATSTHLDSVIKGVRHIDLIKNTALKINWSEVFAKDYDSGGRFYNNFVFNGYGLRQITDKPFVNTWKDISEQLKELNQDFQILENKKIFVGDYKDFYPNRDLGAFLQMPDEDYKVNFNDRYKAQNFEYKYKKYEQEDQQDNTMDIVHTDSQWLLPNKQVEGITVVEVPYVRDSKIIERIRRLNFSATNRVSITDDDTVFILDCVELPPNSKRRLRNFLNVYISYADNTDTIKILSNQNFSWDLLGFGVGAEIFFSILHNDTTYAFDTTVLEIEPTLLTLTRYSIGLPPGLPAGHYTSFVYMEYELTEVFITNRTNEDFDVIQGISQPDRFSNLQYTIKRNMKYWEPYISTLCNFSQDGIIRNTYFKTNGELITEFQNGGLIKENENIPVSELEERVITSVVHTVRFFCEFDDAVELFKACDTVTEDSICGFIRVYDHKKKLIKGYPRKLTYEWASKTMEGEIEEKHESDFINVSLMSEGGLIYINETGYDDKIVKPLEYKANGDYLQLFDKRGVPLTNPAKYDRYKVNGQEFNNIFALSKAIAEIW